MAKFASRESRLLQVPATVEGASGHLQIHEQLHHRRDFKVHEAAAMSRHTRGRNSRWGPGRQDRFCPLPSCCGVRSGGAQRQIHAACREKNSQSSDHAFETSFAPLPQRMEMEWTWQSHANTWPKRRVVRSEPESRLHSRWWGSQSNAQGGEEAKGLKPSPLGLFEA